MRMGKFEYVKSGADEMIPRLCVTVGVFKDGSAKVLRKQLFPNRAVMSRDCERYEAEQVKRLGLILCASMACDNDLYPPPSDEEFINAIKMNVRSAFIREMQ